MMRGSHTSNRDTGVFARDLQTQGAGLSDRDGAEEGDSPAGRLPPHPNPHRESASFFFDCGEI